MGTQLCLPAGDDHLELAVDEIVHKQVGLALYLQVDITDIPDNSSGMRRDTVATLACKNTVLVSFDKLAIIAVPVLSINDFLFQLHRTRFNSPQSGFFIMSFLPVPVP
ncbi:MAG: hypothetical protein FJ333_10065 [Sphingomonadales bacterium]|nr:hypothetical protein [Sphingomonadales bacterium]